MKATTVELWEYELDKDFLGVISKRITLTNCTSSKLKTFDLW